MSTGMSEEVRQLLMRPEGVDVDFKANTKVDAEDLVAFANSEQGGILLLGVDEETVDGVQRGKVVGCDVDDEARLSIVNKAAGCIPPVEVHVEIEREDDKSFFVVTVPSGKEKPYCTPGGTYKIRGDGRNVPLAPPNLLELLPSLSSQTECDATTNAAEQALLEIRKLAKGLNTLAEKVHEITEHLGITKESS